MKVHTPKRIFDMAGEEGTVVWKAKKVTHPESLQSGEVYITHCRVRDDTDCNLLLARIDTSESVLVSESLAILAEDADAVYQSLSGMKDFKDDAEIIISSIATIPGLQGKGSFCRYAYAVYIGCKEDGTAYDAIQRSGMQLFWEVLESLAEEHPENTSLEWLSRCEGEDEIVPLQAFARMFALLHERHQKSHPFSFICGDVDLAEAALQVLKYLVEDAKREKFKEITHLIRATIPLVEGRIHAKKKADLQERMRVLLDTTIIQARQPKRKLVW